MLSLCIFSEKCYWVWGWGVGSDMVRRTRLVSYACLYTTEEISGEKMFFHAKIFFRLFSDSIEKCSEVREFICPKFFKTAFYVSRGTF